MQNVLTVNVSTVDLILESYYDYPRGNSIGLGSKRCRNRWEKL